MTREEAKEMARSRDCSCVHGKDRDNNYHTCIDKIFDWHESEVEKLNSNNIEAPPPCKKFDPFPNGVCRTCGTNHRKK